MDHRYKKLQNMKTKILNLYAGIGGNRKLWKGNIEVTAVEYNGEIAAIYKTNYPKDNVIVADAHRYLKEYYKDFDFIWGSPPCPTHSEMRRCITYKGQVEAVYPDMKLYQEIIFLKYFAKKETKWVIENVKPYYDPLISPQRVIGRHYFWSNFFINKNESFVDNYKVEDTTGFKPRFGFDISTIKTDHRKDHRKDQILRNLVDPEIGLYILEQSKIGKQPIFNFNF